MEKTKEVKTSVGIFIVAKPKAGIRNRAMVNAESDKGVIKNTKLMVELLPKCIQSRPDNFDKDVDIKDQLDDLDPDDFDLLVDALAELLVTKSDKEGQKKTSSNLSSKEENSQNL